ncbi:hypothetical protein SAY86_017500 [Trapa natans]|uniref:Homeobox-leucine zipper protein n=1 Tax=Trapa natans TaxID=22666 RepID=A0AAN7LPE7_TRANT|nr:hypothetical protein SAY86_017500 [Trapa natans]
MKRLGSSDSLGALMSICRVTEENGSPRGSGSSAAAAAIYGREFQSILEGLDEEGSGEELVMGGPSEKKRRLSAEQVKALEKNFEVENKLEPERKVKLAQDLGLQPRQVAVWFQNRRARWKTKQLERDYGVLKATYDSLKLSYDSLQRDNHILLKEIKDLKVKVKLNEENSDQSNLSVREDTTAASESEITKLIEVGKVEEPAVPPVQPSDLDPKETNHSSDSDTSAVLSDENAATSSSSPSNAAISSLGLLQAQQQDPMMYQPHYVKLEEHNFLGDETVNFFSYEQAPTMQWYCPDQWN